MSELVLTGIDGMNPQGLMAALGVLRVLDEGARARGEASPRLSWRDEGYWNPVLHGVEDLKGVVQAVLSDLQTWAEEPALKLAYSKDGERLDPNDSSAVRDLKPKPEIQRAVYQEAVVRAQDAQPRTAQMMAAFGSELALDNNLNIKPTALHFTAGQQQFLKMVNQVRDGVTQEDVRQALVGPWTYESKLPSLSWAGTGARTWALRASDPSKDKRGSCPGAEWLAFVGLSFFPCVPRRTHRGPRVFTTGVQGGWKDSALTWPLWTAPATATGVASLLRTADLSKMSSEARRARGIGVVLRSEISRSDQGGYGSFSPAAVV